MKLWKAEVMPRISAFAQRSRISDTEERNNEMEAEEADVSTFTVYFF